ncbi:MAG: stage III sporulation protein AE [Clostridiales bacterium]|jgi:stage III sporulation protein AE|nr:stage III sporulation protein AE [Clostridiales bacterium]
MIKKILFFMFILILIFSKCYSKSNNENFLNEILEEEAEKHILILDAGLDSIEKIDFGGFYPNFSVRDLIKKITFGKFEVNFPFVIKTITEMIFGEILNSFRSIGFVVLISVFCFILCDLFPNFSRKGAANVTFFVCFMYIAGILSKNFYNSIECARTSIDNLEMFMNTLIFSVSSLSVLNGSVSVYSILIVIVKVIIYVIKRLFLPLIVLSGGTVMVSSLTERTYAKNLSSFLKKMVKWIFMSMITVFACVISMHGICVKNAECLMIKFMKLGMTNLVPVVGRILSESAEIFVSCGTILKNSAGVIGCVIIILISLTSILKIFAYLVSFHLMSIIVEPIADKKISICILELTELISTILSMVVSVCVMFVIITALTFKITSIY